LNFDNLSLVISDFDLKSWRLLRCQTRNTVSEFQGSALAENENELRIEREWRQQLETAAVNEKEAAARLREEVAFLQKVAGVS
jgi:hypothetical protein